MGRVDKPNVLLIRVDQMRYDTSGCYGNSIYQTPNINRITKEGITFTDAYTICHFCSPSRVSILTGLFAFKHGMETDCNMYHSLSRELSDPGQLLHYKLQELDYNCGYAGKWQVGTELGPGTMALLVKYPWLW
jgi:arylsulfatase A-like enzyme